LLVLSRQVIECLHLASDLIDPRLLDFGLLLGERGLALRVALEDCSELLEQFCRVAQALILNFASVLSHVGLVASE